MRDASSVNEDSSSDGAMRTGHLSTDFDLVDFEKAVRLRPKAGAAPRAAIGRALGSVASRLKAKPDAATSMVLTESRIPNSGQGAGAPLQPPAVHDGLVAADGPLQAKTSSSAPVVSAQLKRLVGGMFLKTLVSFVALPLRKMGRAVCVSGGELFDKVQRFVCAQLFDIPQRVKEVGLRLTNWAL